MLSFITVYTVAVVATTLVLLAEHPALTTSTSPAQNVEPGQMPEAAPGQQPETRAEPGPPMVGIVEWRGSTADDRARQAAVMFNDYFSSINDGRYQEAAELYDPVLLDASQADQVDTFRQALSTTTDRDIVLYALRDDTSGRGTVEASLTFRSQQAAGFGPARAPDETCTLWDITYILSEPRPQDYRIAGVSSYFNEPC